MKCTCEYDGRSWLDTEFSWSAYKRQKRRYKMFLEEQLLFLTGQLLILKTSSFLVFSHTVIFFWAFCSVYDGIFSFTSSELLISSPRLSKKKEKNI
jgi:hypothetical protein